METKQIHLFDDRYVFVSQDHEVCSILHSLGHVKVNPDSDPKWFTRKSWINCKYRALFVLVGEGEYLEIWGITSNIPWDHLYATKITQKQVRSWRAYVISEGLQGGYLPSDVIMTTSKRNCLEIMRDKKESLLNYEYIVQGSAESGYAYRFEDQDYFPYSVLWDYETFTTKAARDQFIAQNSEF